MPWVAKSLTETLRLQRSTWLELFQNTIPAQHPGRSALQHLHPLIWLHLTCGRCEVAISVSGVVCCVPPAVAGIFGGRGAGGHASSSMPSAGDVVVQPAMAQAVGRLGPWTAAPAHLRPNPRQFLQLLLEGSPCGPPASSSAITAPPPASGSSRRRVAGCGPSAAHQSNTKAAVDGISA